jgi:hypothetical protein
MKTKAAQNARRGSDFREFLAGEGILPEVEVLALKRVVSLQLQQILEQEHARLLVLPRRDGRNETSMHAH